MSIAGPSFPRPMRERDYLESIMRFKNTSREGDCARSFLHFAAQRMWPAGLPGGFSLLLFRMVGALKIGFGSDKKGGGPLAAATTWVEQASPPTWV